MPTMNNIKTAIGKNDLSSLLTMKYQLAGECLDFVYLTCKCCVGLYDLTEGFIKVAAHQNRVLDYGFFFDAGAKANYRVMYLCGFHDTAGRYY